MKTIKLIATAGFLLAATIAYAQIPLEPNAPNKPPPNSIPAPQASALAQAKKDAWIARERQQNLTNNCPPGWKKPCTRQITEGQHQQALATEQKESQLKWQRYCEAINDPPDPALARVVPACTARGYY